MSRSLGGIRLVACLCAPQPAPAVRLVSLAPAVLAPRGSSTPPPLSAPITPPPAPTPPPSVKPRLRAAYVAAIARAADVCRATVDAWLSHCEIPPRARRSIERAAGLVRWGDGGTA